MSPKFTRRHYEDIAGVLAEAEDAWWGDSDAFLFLSIRMADLFQADNPNFDRERFLTASNWPKVRG